MIQMFDSVKLSEPDAIYLFSKSYFLTVLELQDLL